MTPAPDQHFVKILNENLGIAHKVCRIYFRDIDDQQDCFQEMMYQLWRSYPAFRGASKFSTWMYQVCLNTALTYRKRNPGYERLTAEHLNIRWEESQEEEEIAQLLKAIATLTPVNKAIILLYLEEMSYDEIAAITGLTKTNVSVKLVRIKKELETKLKDLKTDGITG